MFRSARWRTATPHVDAPRRVATRKGATKYLYPAGQPCVQEEWCGDRDSNPRSFRGDDGRGVRATIPPHHFLPTCASRTPQRGDCQGRTHHRPFTSALVIGCSMIKTFRNAAVARETKGFAALRHVDASAAHRSGARHCERGCTDTHSLRRTVHCVRRNRQSPNGKRLRLTSTMTAPNVGRRRSWLRLAPRPVSLA
jgi:hypothetical protein